MKLALPKQGDMTSLAIIVGSLAAAYIVAKFFQAGSAAVDGVSKFSQGLRFDSATLGPKAEPTQQARMSEAEYIRLGYMVRLSDGRTRITSAGERYIARQMAEADRDTATVNQQRSQGIN